MRFAPLFPLHNIFDPYWHFLTVFDYFQRAYKAAMTSDPLCEYSSLLVSCTYPKNQLSKVKIDLFPLHNLFDPYRHFLTVFGYFQRAYKAPMTSDPLCEYSSFLISCIYPKNQLSKVKNESFEKKYFFQIFDGKF